MFIVSTTKNVSVKEKQIDAPIQKLWVKGSIEIDNIVWTSNPGEYIITALDKALISLQKQTPNGNQPLLLPIGLGSIAEISSAQEGHLNCKLIATAIGAAELGRRRVDFELSIDLSANGAIASTDGHFILMSLDLSASEITTIDIYGIDCPIVSESFTKYVQLKVNANTQKSINVQGKDVISLPRTGFSQIDIVFPDRTVTYKEDVKVITQSLENLVMNYVTVYNDLGNNPLAVPESVYAQSYYDGVKFHTIGVNGAIEVKVLYSVDTTVVLTETVL